MNKYTIGSFALLLAAASSVQAAGDAARGEAKSQVCQACHLKDGNSSDPQYPRIAGQYHDYLEHSLRAYKSGERNNAIMKGFADTLTDQDIEDLAAFYASQEGVVDLSGEDG
jgi:cytochrome c553